MKIVGLVKRPYDSEFNGKRYTGNNYIIYYEKSVTENGVGVTCNYIKVKEDVINKLLSDYNIDDYTELLDYVIDDVYYDEYKRVKSVVLK